MARFVGIGECESVSGAAVVIDVMRAYTVAAWAMHKGASRMILVDDLEEALETQGAISGVPRIEGWCARRGIRSV